MAKNIPFPIKTDTACLLKWNWSSIWLNKGIVSSCHRNKGIKIPIENFDNFHNLPYYLDHRRSMLKGEWPSSPGHLGCGYCKKIEDAGVRSDRQYMNISQTDQTPDELVNDPTAIEVTPAVLEVFLDNTCNLACTYCCVEESSKILAESKKYDPVGDFTKKYFGNRDRILSSDEKNQYKELLINWLKQNGSKLRRLHLLGGEPFYIKDFIDFINIWKDFPNEKLIINVVSNVNVNFSHWKKQIDLLSELIEYRCIEDFELTASIDCWGVQQEYLRTGFKCDLVEKNIEYYLSKSTTKYLNINSTHSLLSIPYYSELIKKKIEWEEKFKKPIRTFGMKVVSKHVEMDMLGGDFYKEYVMDLLTIHPKTTWDDAHSVKNFLGLIKSISNEKASIEKIKNFLEVYNELDRRRKTSWRNVFPKIAAEIEKYKDDLV